MQVEQAVFTSTRTNRFKGYHLVARSPGVDYRLAQSLCQWSPSHGSLLDADRRTQSLNFFPLNRSVYALARTVYGGPEYSGRGGRQIVTRILIFRREQLNGYHDHPLALARTTLPMGLLHLSTIESGQLPAVELPDRALTEPMADRRIVDSPWFAQLLRVVQTRQRVAIVGLADPVRTVDTLLSSMPTRQRLEMSFCTGLRPSAQRRFRMQFLPDADRPMRNQLANQQIEYYPLRETVPT